MTKLKKSSHKESIDVINSNNSNKIHKKLLNFIWNYIKFLFINYNSIWMAFLGYFLGMFYTPDCKILITFICILIVTALSDYFVKIELINKAKSEQKNMSNLENILNDSNVPDTSSIISKINSDLYTNQFNNNNKPSKP